MAQTLFSIVTNALIEAEWLSQGEVPQAQDANFVLSKINDLLDTWAADERYVFAHQFGLYTLTPGLSPHTIGPDPSANFSTPIRPIRIDGGNIVISNSDSTTTDIPINTTRDSDWWNYVRIKNLQSQIPTDLYYQPNVPNGQLYFWPVPNFNYQVRLDFWQAVLQFVSVNDPIVLPPAYRKAITLTVASELDGPRSADPMLLRSAAEARSVIWQNNAQAPTMSTMQAGMPSSRSESRSMPDFNFLDGRPW